MKKKDLQKIQSHSLGELQKDAVEKRDKLFSLKKDLNSGKLKNVRQLRELRRDIARILTLVKNKQTVEKVKAKAVK